MSLPESPEQLPTLAQRAVINSLSLFRLAYAFELERHLSETLPEERGWLHAGATAVAAATDFADGYLSRRWGATPLGIRLDEWSDKVFGNVGMQKLKSNGEIPAVHADISLARDIAITGLRAVAGFQHRRIPSVKAGKARTANQLRTLTLADSPLANSGQLRSGAAFSSALALTSLAENVFDYIKAGHKDKPVDMPATGRNSKLRSVFEKQIDGLVTGINEKLPRVTPDHLTLAGVVLVLAGDIMVVKDPDRPVVPTAIYTLGSLLDALDGSLARKKGELNGGTTKEGMLLDLVSDRVQEVITFGALSLIARRRGNRVAADNYALAAMTSALPALIKAHAETKGLVVREGGIGTRVGRGILGGAGLAFNGRRDTTDILSATVASNNIVTARSRSEVVSKRAEAAYYRGQNDDEKFMEAAGVKRKVLLGVSALGAAAGAGLMVYNRRSPGTGN
jgi:phosphatidylglycerophosphate synthase